MKVTSIIPLHQGTRFVIGETIPTSCYPAIKENLKENLPSIVSVHINEGEESVNDVIEVIHDFQELSAEAIRNELEKMVFEKNGKCVFV
jgi:hypothetical protein